MWKYEWDHALQQHNRLISHCIDFFSRSSWDAWLQSGSTKKEQGKTKELNKCFKKFVWAFTLKNFSAYLHVSLSLFSVLSTHLCICGPSYLSFQVPSVSVFFYICLLPLLVADSLLTGLWLILCICVLPLLVVSLLSLNTPSGEDPHFWTFGHQRLAINTQADNQSPGNPKRCNNKIFSSH